MTMTPPINATSSGYSIPELLTTVMTLAGVILTTIVGNAFVIAAVVLERNLRSHVANYLIASLAVADLLVALLVMPLAVVNQVCLCLSLFSLPIFPPSLSSCITGSSIVAVIADRTACKSV